MSISTSASNSFYKRFFVSYPKDFVYIHSIMITVKIICQRVNPNISAITLVSFFFFLVGNAPGMVMIYARVTDR